MFFRVSCKPRPRASYQYAHMFTNQRCRGRRYRDGRSMHRGDTSNKETGEIKLVLDDLSERRSAGVYSLRVWR